MGAQLGPVVDRALTKHAVGDGGDACGHHHSNAVGGARMIEGERRGCKVLHDAREDLEHRALLLVIDRRAPHARRHASAASRSGQREQLREHKLDERKLEERRVVH